MALKRFLQICCIVEDCEKTMNILRDEFGFENWYTFNSPDNYIQHYIYDGKPLPDYRINGEPAELNNSATFCTAFGIEWEFIQPGSGPLKTWIEEHGPGIHHFAVIADDSYEEFRQKCKRLSGKDVWLNGTAPSIGMNYSYYDLTKEIGMFLEVYDDTRVHGSGFNIERESDPPLKSNN